MRRPEYEAFRWQAQADDDLKFARWVLDEDQFFDKGCFIAQQAAEKSLKALLYLEGARTVIGHSGLDLLNRLTPHHPELQELREAVVALDRFYIPTRYPNGLPGGAPYQTFVRSDLERAVEMAEKVLKAMADLIGRQA